MKKILRYVVKADEPGPIGEGKILFVHASRTSIPERGNLDVWVEVEVPHLWPITAEPQQTVWVLGTGATVPESFEHVGTCLDGHFVWHVYKEV